MLEPVIKTFKVNKRYVVWALFDDATRSYYHALNFHPQIKVISVGINNLNEDNYHRIDLSITNPNLINELKMLPAPDIILASPPCEGWSNADNQRRAIKDFQYSTLSNEVMFMNLRTQKFYNENNPLLQKSMKRDFYNAHCTRLIAEGTTLGLMKIIKTFNPKYWVIENPMTSKIWDYLKIFCDVSGFYNVARYNNYDENFPQKPTIFFSNRQFELKSQVTQSKITLEDVSGYNKRAAIPEQLIKDYVFQLIYDLNS